MEPMRPQNIHATREYLLRALMCDHEPMLELVREQGFTKEEAIEHLEALPPGSLLSCEDPECVVEGCPMATSA